MARRSKSNQDEKQVNAVYESKCFTLSPLVQ